MLKKRNNSIKPTLWIAWTAWASTLHFWRRGNRLARCRADSSVVSHHLVINNKTSEWMRVVAERRIRLIWSFFFFSFIFLNSITGAPCWTHTSTFTLTHTLCHAHRHKNTKWLDVKHELHSLFSALKSPLAGRRGIGRFSPETRQKFFFFVVRHSEEWHHSLLKLKGRNAFSKTGWKFFFLLKYFSASVLAPLCFLPPPRQSGGARRTGVLVRLGCFVVLEYVCVYLC